MPKWLFWRSRLWGIWRLLTCRYFVVMSSNQDATSVHGNYNVSHSSYRRLVRMLDVAIEHHEAGADLLKEAKQILDQP